MFHSFLYVYQRVNMALSQHISENLLVNHHFVEIKLAITECHPIFRHTYNYSLYNPMSIVSLIIIHYCHLLSTTKIHDLSVTAIHCLICYLAS